MRFYGVELRPKVLHSTQIKQAFKQGAVIENCKLICVRQEERDTYYLAVKASINITKDNATKAMFSSLIYDCWDLLGLDKVDTMPMPHWYKSTEAMTPRVMKSYISDTEIIDLDEAFPAPQQGNMGGFEQIQKLLQDNYLKWVELSFDKSLCCKVLFHPDVTFEPWSGINTYTGNVDKIAVAIILDLEQMLGTQSESYRKLIEWLQVPVRKTYWGPQV